MKTTILKILIGMAFVLQTACASTLTQNQYSQNYIKGSFIQPHLFENWDDARWQKEFSMLQDAGIEFLIFMHTVYTDEEGKIQCVYPSELSGIEQKEIDLLEICLRNAKQTGFKIFVGLNFNERWWKLDFTSEWLYGEMSLGNQIAKELIQRYKKRYPETMAGWYWIWEIEPSICKDISIRDMIVKAMNINLDFLHSETPDMPFLFSPFMNCQQGTSENCAEVWKYILENIHLQDGDIFAPQDCIGSGFLNLDVVEGWYEKMESIIPKSPKIKYWANIEMFDQRFWTAASLDRIKQQMDVLRPYVSGFISFAYSHYYSPLLKTPLLHKAYAKYVKTGTFPHLKAPMPIRNLKQEKNNDGLSILVWRAPEKETDVVGYHIYKDGIMIADIQYDNQGCCEREYKVFDSGLYEIAAYNVYGDESIKNKIRIN